MTDLTDRPAAVGDLLRSWRQRRRLSQMDLALQAEVSTRHLSFVETGRAKPSAEMVLHLAEQLEIPLRDRNLLLLAAGFAPAFGQRGLDEPEMGPVRAALDRVLAGHMPYPALVVDRHWGMVAANDAVALLTAGVAPHLMEPPLNVLRASLHPEGMAPDIVNLAEWSGHLLDRLHRQALTSGDPALHALHAELSSYPRGQDDAAAAELDTTAVAVPLVFRTRGTELRFLSLATTFGSALDVTVAELAIEAFFPADERTAGHLREFATLTA